MGTAVDVCVVIVSHNSLRFIEALLDSLPAAMEGLRYQTVVVENGSTDGSLQYLLERPDVTLVKSTNVGYAAGINKGAASAQSAGAMLVLNPDTILEPGSGRILMSRLGDRRVGIVAPRVVNAAGSLEHSLRREPSLTRALGLSRLGLGLVTENLTRPVDYEYGHPVDWALGAVLLVSADCTRSVGGWDESYFLYSEETDFCLRARDHGLVTWYEPSAVAMHVGGGSGQTPKTQTLRALNSVRLYGRRHGMIATYAFWLFTLLREIYWAVRRREFTVVSAMMVPAKRPTELGCSDTLLPR